ncbi:MAG: thrombospondin type 3 repeat-containing protein, partial [Verrucomicrobiota bacterium]
MTVLTSVSGQSNISYVLDGSGGLSGQAGWTNISASGQPGGITVSSDGPLVNYAGFLNTFSLRPTLDTDADGLEDELDADNDNDDLTDLAEILGSDFDPQTITDPNNPDSDGDGATDGEEAVAGSNPVEAGEHLRILWLTETNGLTRFAFRGRGGATEGKTYVIHSSTSLTNLSPNPISTNATPAGGVPPWYVVTNIFSSGVFNNDARRYFAVEVLP